LRRQRSTARSISGGNVGTIRLGGGGSSSRMAASVSRVVARRKGGATETTSAPLSPSPSPWWLRTLDAALVLVAVVALVIRVSDGIDWKIGSLSLTARTAGRAFALRSGRPGPSGAAAAFAFAPALRPGTFSNGEARS
jgi:hypothetical protein